jgi:DNA topoisomerase-1
VKGHLQPTPLGLNVDRFLQEALPDLLEAEFTAQMEAALDQIAAGQQEWQHYLTHWHQSYFVPALAKAKQVIPQHLTHDPPPRAQKVAELSKTRCPQCNNFLAKIPSRKVKKKYFLKCVSGCADVVLFWSQYSRKWEPPHTKSSSLSADAPKSPNTVHLTQYLCPACQHPMEEYHYEKDGQAKKLLRCSDAKKRSDRNHQDTTYFHTAKGWWNPKRGMMEESTHSPELR